jgi:stress response protein SCP2
MEMQDRKSVILNPEALTEEQKQQSANALLRLYRTIQEWKIEQAAKATLAQTQQLTQKEAATKI